MSHQSDKNQPESNNPKSTVVSVNTEEGTGIGFYDKTLSFVSSGAFAQSVVTGMYSILSTSKIHSLRASFRTLSATSGAMSSATEVVGSQIRPESRQSNVPSHSTTPSVPSKDSMSDAGDQEETAIIADASVVDVDSIVREMGKHNARGYWNEYTQKLPSAEQERRFAAAFVDPPEGVTEVYLLLTVDSRHVQRGRENTFGFALKGSSNSPSVCLNQSGVAFRRMKVHVNEVEGMIHTWLSGWPILLEIKWDEAWIQMCFNTLTAVAETGKTELFSHEALGNNFRKMIKVCRDGC